MKARWWILAAAGSVVVLIWSAVVITYFMHPNLAVWTALVPAGALSLEGFLWVCAGVLGFSFLAKRRAALTRLKDRLFGGSRRSAE
jgi:hypothetical protein